MKHLNTIHFKTKGVYPIVICEQRDGRYNISHGRDQNPHLSAEQAAIVIGECVMRGLKLEASGELDD